MKGIVLAGGKGTRLYPLTKVTNKHLLPVGKEPMIFNPIKQLVSAGIKDILVVTSTEHMGDMVNLLGSGKQFGVDFTYKVQESAGGIAQALGLAEDFAGSGKIIVILGDNVFQQNLKRAVNNFKKQKSGAKIFLSRVKNPQAYGIAQIVKNKIVGIEEKPKNPKNNLAVVGVYFYDNQVFKIIKTLKPSARGELEITDVNNYYVRNKSMRYEILRGWWGDCGESFNSLLQASQLVSKTKNL